MGILVEVLPVMVCSSTQPMPVVGVLQKLALGCMVPSGMLFTSFFSLEITFIELKKNGMCLLSSFPQIAPNQTLLNSSCLCCLIVKLSLSNWYPVIHLQLWAYGSRDSLFPISMSPNCKLMSPKHYF